MSLKERWIRSIYTVATGSRKLRFLLTPVVGLSYLTFAAFFGVAALLADRWLKLPAFPQDPLHLMLSLPLIAAGLGLVFWCLINFFKARGTPVPFNPPLRLVTSGPYAYSRNPMLTGVFLLLFGIGFGLQSIGLVFVFTPLFILVNVVELKMIEEPELQLRLGQDYLNYRQNTPMFFPKLRTNKKRKESYDRLH